MITSRRRLGAGEVLRTGARGQFRGVAEAEGEPHTVRADLVDGVAMREVAARRVIACVAHITDLHVTDVQSPARFEFINRELEDPRFRELLPMQRPQEALNAHAIDAMVRTLNQITAAPITGSPLERALMTGDAIDNSQLNELANFIALFGGGPVRPESGGPGYEGVQATGWPDDIYWKPDGDEQDRDVFRSQFGFPREPGLLKRAMAPFQGAGFSLPWLGCCGNHEELSQGVGVVTTALARAMVASRKPLRLPSDFNRDSALETFVNAPETFMAGPYIDVTQDPSRRAVRRGEFVDAHFHRGASPNGHGFTERNRRAGTAYYVHDTAAVRYITLDTACPLGGADGCIDATQMHWLERSLEEVHSSFRSRDGAQVTGRNPDRLVVIASHHGLDTLSNPRALGPGYCEAGELLELMHRFGNVVLWLNGHIHANRITPRVDPRGGHGFWEVTTSSLVDWPCQARLVELFDAGEGMFAVACTMVDHDGAGLSGLHRELAGNVPFNGFDSWRPGTPADRNVILLIRAPF